MSMGVSSKRDWYCEEGVERAAEREISEETSGLELEGEECVVTESAKRDEESGGVGGACGGQVEAVGGVAGMSRGGERRKAEESEGEREGESWSCAGELDIAHESVERTREARDEDERGSTIRTCSGITGSSMQRLGVLGWECGRRPARIIGRIPGKVDFCEIRAGRVEDGAERRRRAGDRGGGIYTGGRQWRRTPSIKP